jgi:hypothetical protein
MQVTDAMTASKVNQLNTNVESLIKSIQALDASNTRSARRMLFLTWVIAVLTAVLVGLTIVMIWQM